MSKPITKSETVCFAQEEYFLETFQLIQQIALRMIRPFHLEEVEDITQEVKLGLLKWKMNRPDQVYTFDEWLKIANTATQNEIKTFYTKKSKRSSVIISIDEINVDLYVNKNFRTANSEGDTEMKIHSLLKQIWKLIQTQSLVEHYALLLKKQELISYLIGYRICGSNEMAGRLKLTKKEFERLIETLPLSDVEIASLLEREHNLKITSEALRKVRQRSLSKLRSVLASKNQHIAIKTNQKNGRASVTRENKNVSTKQTAGT
ncbi:MAG: hypothetical protein H0U96_05415 [Acidobacteria bacterium]|jgi:hypothetical protein|nr:hypothetical protein [Acidobacteriota bacterium]